MKKEVLLWDDQTGKKEWVKVNIPRSVMLGSSERNYIMKNYHGGGKSVIRIK